MKSVRPRRLQPAARIVCIRPITTRTTQRRNGTETIGALRDVVSNVVADRVAAGDRNLFVVSGEEITSDANLSSGKDPVHLSIPGAALFAEAMVKQLAAMPPASTSPH